MDSQGMDEQKLDRDMKTGVISWNKWSVKVRPYGGATVKFDALWLRDSCTCPRCVDPDSGQKTFSTTDLPDVPQVGGAIFTGDGALEVTFKHDPLSGGKDHTSIYSRADIKKWSDGESGVRGMYTPAVPSIPWNKAIYESKVVIGACRISYKDWINNDSDAFWNAFTDLASTGLIIVTDVPQVEDEVERIAQSIGPIQHTFYGRTWDVKSKPQAENVAYTSQFLGLHQDLMYHSPVPKIQLLHCLENSCAGGESLFSHGVRAAHELRLTAPRLYETLVKNPTYFHYQKNGHHHFFRHPTIVESVPGYPGTTYWAPPFQSTFRKMVGTDFATLRQWKQAATVFKELLESPRNMIEVKLKPGECVIFDNRRVLHGRNEFAADSGGSRWLKGTYISPSVFMAKETQLARRLGLVTQKTKEAKRWAQTEVRLVNETLPEHLRLATPILPEFPDVVSQMSERMKELDSDKPLVSQADEPLPPRAHKPVYDEQRSKEARWARRGQRFEWSSERHRSKSIMKWVRYDEASPSEPPM